MIKEQIDLLEPIEKDSVNKKIISEENQDVKYYIPVHKNNLHTILASGIVIPSSNYYEYKDDVQIICSDSIIMSKNGFNFNKIEGTNIDNNFTVLLEININKLDKNELYKFSNKKFTRIRKKLDSQFLYYKNSISILSIENIFFKSRNELDDFKARIFENVPLGLISMNVSEKIFEIKKVDSDLQKVFDQNENKEYRNYVKYQLSDSIAGMFANLLNFIPAEISHYKFLKEFSVNIIKNHKFILPESFIKYSLDQDLFDLTIKYLLREKKSDGWQSKKILKYLYESINKDATKYDSETIKLFKTWYEMSIEVLDNKRTISSLADNKFIMGKAIILLLLRPTPDDLLSSQNSNLEPGKIVLTITSIFIGARYGLECLSNKYKAENIEVFKFALTIKDTVFNDDKDYLIENDINILENYFEDSLQSSIKLSYKNNVLIEKINKGSDELNRILILAKSRKKQISLSVDREFNRLKYQYDFKNGRKQIVYIKVGEMTENGTKTIRFYSPCLDLSLEKNKEFIKKNAWEIFERMNESERFCRFAIDSKLKLFIVLKDEVDSASMDHELDFLEHVAKVADNFERNFGIDEY
jgi:hypothetical protein